MNVPTTSWDEGSPSGLQALSLMGIRIRELKTQLREVIAIDHIFESSGSGNNWGFHKKITFTKQTADESAALFADPNTGILYTTDVDGVSELHWLDEDDHEIQLTSGEEFIGGITGELKLYQGLLADIPDGWALCLDLIGKFARCVPTAGTEQGTSGGSDTATLTEDNITAHTHTLQNIVTGLEAARTGTKHDHFYLAENLPNAGYTEVIKQIGGGSGYTVYVSGIVETNSGQHSNHVLSNAGGGSTTYDNRPAYVELAYIIKI